MRRFLLPFHIVAGVGLIGADLALVALGVQALSGAPLAEVYPAMSLVATAVMLPLGALALGSGLALTRASGVGLRVAWVRAKLGITVLLATVLVGFLIPGLAAVAEDATAGDLDRAPVQYAVGPLISATLLVLNVVLATTRPTRLPWPGSRSRSLSDAPTT